jgi:hypothetical protein
LRRFEERNMQPLILDRRSEVDVPPDYTVVETEAQWLRLVSTFNSGQQSTLATGGNRSESPAFMVRGVALCNWAETWWRGRGWPCEERRSPLLTLRALCAGWDEEQARAVWNELRPAWDELAQPLRATDVLGHLFPQTPFAWEATPSFEHAATWLLWLEETEILAHYAPLFAAQATVWDVGAGKAQGLYATSTEEAHARLQAWLGGLATGYD